MAFDSLTFIFFFLPLAVFLYRASPAQARPVVLLLLSSLFYFWGSPLGLLVLFISMAADLGLVKLMQAAGSARSRKLLLALAVGLNIVLLLFFKYANFLILELNHCLAWFSAAPLAWRNTLQVLGISFITFHKISYVVDAYRGGTRATGPLAYANYLALFPKLLQGPITRYRDLAPQFATPRSAGFDDIFDGIYRFSLGLAKKKLIADRLGETADKVFLLDPASLTTGYAWLGAVCYAFQIYFDFSGYSDMAIGIGRMLGLSLPENFNRPYLSASFTEFWRRWHITLSAWLKEYLYIPLGGNRRSPVRTYLNLWTVFLISGLWHGANWTFLFWGAYHGAFLVLDKVFWLKRAERLPRPVTVPATFVLITLGWVLFRSDSIVAAAHYLAAMFDPAGITRPTGDVLLVELMNRRGIFVLALASLLSFFPEQWARTAAGRWSGLLDEPRRSLIQACGAALLLLLSFMDITHSAFVPYIYLRF